jgi:hypothetical protein
VCLDVFVPHAGYLDVWCFTTSTRVWKQVNTTAVNQDRPSARSRTMTSVGLDLWVYVSGVALITGSDELWRFTTSTHMWERVDTTGTTASGARTAHTMTSVGLDLWVHGGYTATGERDACTIRAVLLLLLL